MENSMSITQLSSQQIDSLRAELSDLLIDVVDGGASVSFLAPLTREAADTFWQGVAADVAKGTRRVLVANVEGCVAGCVHLAIATQPNAPHRVEVQKLLVRTNFRRRGLATALMGAAEQETQKLGRTLIVLDTEQGSNGERLYEQLGYQRAGIIPAFARSSGGGFHATVLFYKHLNGE
jgi:GNAT superfamily N-acetyltransferase